MKFSIALVGIKTAAAICRDGGGLATPPLALIRPAKERKLTGHILGRTICQETFNISILAVQKN